MQTHLCKEAALPARALSLHPSTRHSHLTFSATEREGLRQVITTRQVSKARVRTVSHQSARRELIRRPSAKKRMFVRGMVKALALTMRSTPSSAPCTPSIPPRSSRYFRVNTVYNYIDKDLHFTHKHGKYFPVPLILTRLFCYTSFPFLRSYVTFCSILAFSGYHLPDLIYAHLYRTLIFH